MSFSTSLSADEGLVCLEHLVINKAVAIHTIPIAAKTIKQTAQNGKALATEG